MPPISLVTVDMESGNKNRGRVSQTSELLTRDEPDLVLVQESNCVALDLQDKYQCIEFQAKPSGRVDIVDIYLRHGCQWVQESVNEIVSKLSFTKRSGKMITLQHKTTDQTIRIANVHVCGGRHDENDKIGGMLLGNLKNIRERKTETVREMVDTYKADIIAGDFNSDLVCYLNHGTVQPKHLAYLRRISPQKPTRVYQEWNLAPFRYLSNHGYYLAFDRSIVNKDTSFYETHPDAIWYRNGCGNQTEYHQIDLLTDGLSDHNGLYAKFQINH